MANGTTVAIYVPDNLKSQVVTAAKNENRSFSKMCVVLMLAGLELAEAAKQQQSVKAQA